MFVIASNITTRDAGVAAIFRQAREEGWDAAGNAARDLADLARQCAAAGAGAIEINVQQRFDAVEAMRFAVKAVQPAVSVQLCLSANNAAVLEAGLRECKSPALANYLSIDEARLKEMLPAIARHGAGAVLLVSDPSSPADAREMLQKTAILVGAANEAGVSNDRILARSRPGPHNRRYRPAPPCRGLRVPSGTAGRYRPAGQEYLLAGQLFDRGAASAAPGHRDHPAAHAGRHRPLFRVHERAQPP